MDALAGTDRTLFRSYMDEYFMETPGWKQVKRILTGTPPDQAASRESLANPEALDVFIELAKG